MSRRTLVAIAAMALIAAPLAHAERKAADEACTPDATAARTQSEALDLHALFARQAEVVDATTIRPAGMDVLVARIGEDGKPVIGCVSTEEAARRFFASRQTRSAEEK